MWEHGNRLGNWEIKDNQQNQQASLPFLWTANSNPKKQQWKQTNKQIKSTACVCSWFPLLYVHWEKYQLTAAKQSTFFMTRPHIPAQEEQEAFCHCKTSKHWQVVIASNGTFRVNMYWLADGHLGALSIIALWPPTTKDMQIQENQNYTNTVYCTVQWTHAQNCCH